MVVGWYDDGNKRAMVLGVRGQCELRQLSARWLGTSWQAPLGLAVSKVVIQWINPGGGDVRVLCQVEIGIEAVRSGFELGTR